MPIVSILNFTGLNTQINPMTLSDGNIVQAVNVTSDLFGAKTKRPGYVTFQGTADGSAITNLFPWYRADTTTFNLYRNSGGKLWYSLQGTGAWTLAGNGTFTAGSTVGNAVLQDVLITGDGIGSTRHSTDGSTFTNTTLAPISPWFAQFQDRIYASGTASTLFYSSIDDATNWNTSGTSDSSSIKTPGEGRNLFLFKNTDRLHIVKSGHSNMLRWDGANLVDLATNVGPTSPLSVYTHEGVAFWLNRLGVYSYAGSTPQLVSNSIQKLIYNNQGSGIAGTTFKTAPAGGYLYDYFAAVGTITDGITGITTNNAILKYDMRLNECSLWQFNDFPSSNFQPFVDNSGALQMIFGGSGGQVFQLSGTATTDNGTAIQSILEFAVKCGSIKEKFFYVIRLLMNPGCEAQVEFAVSNSLEQSSKVWQPAGQAINGVLEVKLPTEVARGRFLFVKISDNTSTNPFKLYGAEVVFDFTKNAHE